MDANGKAAGSVELKVFNKVCMTAHVRLLNM